MAGLLDFLNTPESQLGIGLLAAASSGQGFGEGLLGAMQYSNQYKNALEDRAWAKEDREIQKRYRDAQIADLTRKAEKDARLQGLLGQMFGQSSPPPGGASLAPSGAAGAAAPLLGGRQGGNIANLTADQVAALKIAGADLTDLWKEARPSYQVQNGYAYDPKAIGPGFLPGIQVSNDGRATVIMPSADRSGVQVGLPKGAAEAFGTYRGIEAGINAAHTPERIYNPATQREEIVPRSAVLGGARNYSGPGYAGGSAAAAATDQIRIMQEEMARLPDGHPDKAAVAREIARLQGAAPQAGMGLAAGPSASEAAAAEAARTRAVDTAKADVSRDTGRREEDKRSRQLVDTIDRAVQLLSQGPTASGMGALIDKAGGFVGYSPKGAEAAQQLEALSGWLTANVPRMQGPQSDKDVEMYRTMAGKVGDRTAPIAQRLAAAQEVKRLQQKYMQLNQELAGQGGASGSWEGPVPDKPMKGQNVGGWKFKGGDPAIQANWERAP